MHPPRDQSDQQRERQVTPRHAPLHSRSQLAAPPQGSVFAASLERLTRGRRAAVPEPSRPPDQGPPDPGAADPRPPDPGAADPRPPDPGAADPRPPDPGAADPRPPDPGALRLREHLETVRLHAQGASSWLETSSHYARLVNRDGVVPVTARFTVHDLAFLAEAREQMLGLADLGLRLIELHQPLDAGGPPDAGGGASQPSAPILRCRSCMWRWPCPTFRTLAEVLEGIPTG